MIDKDALYNKLTVETALNPEQVKETIEKLIRVGEGLNKAGIDVTEKQLLTLTDLVVRTKNEDMHNVVDMVVNMMVMGMKKSKLPEEKKPKGRFTAAGNRELNKK